MTVDELIRAAADRGWRTSLRVPGRTEPDRGDNVYVVDRDADGWYVGFLERGETTVLQRCADEDEAATTAYEHLRRTHERESLPEPRGAAAATPPGDASGEGWTTWTFGRRG
jgi:hypothetical protein